jgi:hypothetical protein
VAVKIREMFVQYLYQRVLKKKRPETVDSGLILVHQRV